jgi:hypothetical protein
VPAPILLAPRCAPMDASRATRMAKSRLSSLCQMTSTKDPI